MVIELDPPVLCFPPGSGEQRLTLTIILHGHSPVRLRLAGPAGRPFRRSTVLPDEGWLTEEASSVEVEVIFNFPPSLPPVSDFITVYASDEDGVWLDDTPLRCELRGNVSETRNPQARPSANSSPSPSR
jgi:hypothetical protein